ncbi:MAG TPA: NAD(P)-dependent oxidoreductase [Planctomycetaceae bacterium]|nr:NAD(P)-dependent oxidoreductase [Planctomycetaceae bacterium]
MAEKIATSGTLIVGCGYIGSRVAAAMKRLQNDGPVYAMTRSRTKAEVFAAVGFEPVIADWTDRRTLSALPRCQRVLVAVSYDSKSGVSREDSQVGGLSNLLDFLPISTDICYLSTTGVYHQSDGSWVDETSPARPIGEGGKAHLRAESLLHRRRPNSPWTILRLAGIYGPGRIPRVADVLAGRPIEGPNCGYLNLIHRDDAVSAILAAWTRRQDRHNLYLVADDQPVIRSRFYEQIAVISGVPSPKFAANDKPSLSARSASNKRVWNRRLRRDLLSKLDFPTYVQGLTDLLR